MIKAEIVNSKDRSKGVWITMPAMVEELQASMNTLPRSSAANETVSYEVRHVETDIPQITFLIQNDEGVSISLDEINLLAYMSENMDSDEHALFCDILNYKEPDSFDECIGIAASVRAGAYEIWRDTTKNSDVGVEYINRYHPKLPEIIYSNLSFDGVALDVMEQKGGAIVEDQYIHNLEPAPIAYDSSMLGVMLKQERQEHEGHTAQSQNLTGGMPPMT